MPNIQDANVDADTIFSDGKLKKPVIKRILNEGIMRKIKASDATDKAFTVLRCLPTRFTFTP